MSETLCVGAAEHVRAAAEVLDDAGISVAVVPDGETARERVRREAVRCVVTALELPDQSGAQLAKSVDAAPTIVCAADGDEHVAAQVLADGAGGYVPADDLETALVDQVRSVLPDDREVSDRGAERESNDEHALNGASEPIAERERIVEREPKTERSAGSETGAAESDAGAAESEASATESEVDTRDPDVGGATGDASGGARSDTVDSWNALFGSGTETEPPTYAFDVDDVAAFVDGDAAFADGDAAFVHSEESAEEDGRAPDQVRRAQTLEALHWATDDLFGDENAASIADSVAAAADRVLGVDLAAVYLDRTDVDAYEPIAARGASADDLPKVERTQPDATDSTGDERGDEPGDGHGDAAVGPTGSGSPAGELPVASVEWFPIGERGLLCLGRDAAEELDGWTRKLASLLASTGDAALDRAERERQLRRTAAVVEAVGDGVVAVDGANRITDLDDTFAGVTGYSRDRLVSEHLSLVVHEEARTRLEACLHELRSDGSPDRRSLAVDLQTRWSDTVRCELTLTCVPAAETDSRVVGVVRDVSQRRRLEARLESCESTIREVHATALRLESARDAQDVYEAAVEGASDALDADRCRIVERDAAASVATSETNPAAGFRVLAARGDAAASESTPAPACVDRLAARALDDGQSRVEERFEAAASWISEPVREDASDPHCSGLAVPVDESTALEVVAYEPAAFGDLQRDLAELLVAHVAATLDRLRHEADLRCQRDRIAALFDNVPNPIVRTRIENDLAIVEAVNPSFERVFGYDTDEIVGEVLDEHIVPPDRVERAQELTRRGLEGEIVETEVHRLTASGTRDFLLTVVPIADGDGNGVNYAIYTDITERKQRQQRLEVLNRVLRHDLRNGMNVVKGSAELLGEHVEGDAAAHVEAIDTRAAEMIDLADKTRTVQRTLQSDPGDVGPVDVVDAVEQANSDLDVSVPGTEIETSLPAQAPARVGKLLPVAVRHVLENAIVHHDGEPTVEVAVRELEDDHTVEVVVADDGPGIPEAERMLVTEQREITQLRHGSGLGLWIVNWVVTGAGGSLEIEHAEPRGTVVRMELPQAPADRCNLPVLLD